MTKKLLLIALVFTSLNLFAQAPLLSNFRVEDNIKNRMYFDSNEPITASSTTGFSITGKTITSISINSSQLTGHYFTVSSPFDFWDNNTIRYEGGSNLQDADTNPLYDFTLTYIENNIPEPDALIYNRYVTTTGAGAHDGTSEANAWTIQEMDNASLSAGTTVWVKAGDYGDVELTFNNDGTASAPIKIVGYKSSPGDITSMYYDYETTPLITSLDSSEMPLIDGVYGGNGTGFSIRSKYFIVRNFQARNYQTIFYATSSPIGVIIDNVVAHTSGQTAADGQSGNGNQGIGINFNSSGSNKNRILNSFIINSSITGIAASGEHFLIEGNKIYNDRTTSGAGEAQDYYINLDAGHSIIRNCYIERVIEDNHGGHGIALRNGTDDYPVHYNLVDNSTVIGVNNSIELRHRNIRYNVVKNCYFNRGNVSSSATYTTGGVPYIRDGASFNIFENNHIYDMDRAIKFRDTAEELSQFGWLPAGEDNIIRNCVYDKITLGIQTMSQGDDGTVNRNEIINCTFNNIDYLYSDAAILMGTGANVNTMTNCIISNINIDKGQFNEALRDHFTETYCAYYNINYTMPVGEGNVEMNPLFVNAASGDFHLQPTSPIKDLGFNVNNVSYDKEGVERVNGKYSIGAFEDTEPIIGSVSPSSVTICAGENVTLVASGGTSYSWSTGETAASITVNPSTTTTYTVSISDGTNSDTHDVIVTVNEAPTVDLGLDQSICYGETVTLTATGTGDFLWNTGETTASITVNPTVTTTYSITASNSCATDATDEIIINVNPEIGLIVGNDISICVGESTTLTATGNGDFLWNTGETTPSITVQPNSTTTYTITSTLGDCNENESVVVTVSEIPSVDLGADQSICYGETITLTATGTGDFLWNTGDTTASITVNPSTTTTYTVTASNSCATDATDDIIINVNPEIGLTVGSDISICTGESTTITANGNGDFLWNTGETTSSITVQPNSTTTYSVASSLGACTENVSILVTVNEPPSVELGPDQSICFGETVTLTANGAGDFLWSTGETGTSITVNPTITTTYSVTASNACTDAMTDEITVNVNPEIGLTVGSDISICTGDNTTLTATGNGDFLWNTGETTSSITVQPNSTTTYTVTSSLGACTENESILVTVGESPSVDLGVDQAICFGESVILTATGVGDFLWSTGETTSSITVNPTNTTTYNVTASNGCNESVSDEVTVVINDIPEVNAGSDITIVSGTSTELTATGQGAFLWSTGETTASISVNPTNTTIYSVTLTSSEGCSSSDTIEVAVQDSNIEVNADAGPDQNICPDSSDTMLTANGGDSYIWSTGETTKSISVKPTVTTVYTVEVFKESVSASDDVTVFIDEKCNNVLDLEVVVYPNPTNGLLHINVPDFSEKMNISIFNLNGQIVYTKSFDKTSSGKLKHQINLSRFGNGVYIVRFSNRYQSSSKKVLVI